MPPVVDNEVKRLRAAIGIFKGQITRGIKFLQEQQDQVLLDSEAIVLRIKLLQDALIQYRSNHLELKILIDECDDDALAEDDVEESCLQTISSLQKVMTASASMPSSPRMTDEKPDAAMSTMTRKLPQFDIPTFSGESAIEYRAFIDMFVAVIGSEETLAPVQKLFYLRKYLKGDALTLIIGLPLINSSYDQAIELLRKRYDNRTIIITHHINSLMDIEKISRGTAQNLRRLVSQARQQLGALKGLGQKVEHWDVVIVTLLIRKLDAFSCRAYFTERDQNKLPSLSDFFEFVEKRALSFEESQQAECKYKPIVSNQLSESLVAFQSKSTNMCCIYCQSDHKLFQCKKFQVLSVKDRVAFVDKNKLCKICLNPHTNKCKFFFKCGICKSKSHSTVLHEQIETVTCQNSIVLCDENTETVACQSSMSTNEVLLPTIKVKIEAKDGSHIIAKGLLDCGSQPNVITSKLMCQLKADTFNHEVKIAALGQKGKPATKAANISLKSVHSDYNYNALFSVVDNITSFLPQNKIDVSSVVLPDNILLADDEFNKPSEISFLLNAKACFKLIEAHKIELPNSPSCELILLATKFGYVVSGDIIQDTDNVCLSSVCLHAAVDQGESVDLLLQKFWDEQHIPEINMEETAKPDVCEAGFQSSVQIINNRFQVKMPLKVPVNDLHLGESFNTALQRLNHLNKRFSKDPQLKETYSNFIKEYIDLGHAQVIDLSAVDIDQYYFMPHHPVIREDSQTTKLRVVFDASVRTKSNPSLNDILHNGPVVQNNLFDILMLFRSYEFVALCDIRQMYRQIRTDPSQNHLQNILWRNNINEPLTCLQLLTVTYGVKSSSFLATRCLIELALRYENSHPLAAEVLKKNTYIDDCLFGASGVSQLTEVCDQLINLLKLGSFELHKWSSNSQQVLSNVPPEKQAIVKSHEFNNNSVLKALGLFLDIQNDNFKICKPSGNIPSEWTKRTVLSCIGAFYDPLGLAGPIVTRAKEFMQKLWRNNLDWDSSLCGELLSEWNNFFCDLMNMQPIIVNRNLKICKADYVDLIGYCDASAIAYGCCIYIRAIHGNDVHVSLLCSKSRIAPVSKQLTIPRLELNGALLLSKLFQKVMSIFSNVNFRHKYLFTDSQIVLYWLCSSKKNITYIQNRVNIINSLKDDCKWFHVKSQNNASDVLSRGINPTQLASCEVWWKGPPEIQNVNYVPKEFIVTKVIDPEPHVQIISCNIQQGEILPISKMSSLLKLQRVFAYVLRFVKNCKINKKERNTEHLTITELRDAMSCLIKHVQHIHFAEEIKYLTNNKEIKSNIMSLNPFLDKFGVMRVAGRLENANLSYNQKHPAILPAKCHLTTLIIRHEHVSLMHSGLKLTHAELSQKYYIINATREVKKVIHKCTTCFRFRAQSASQLMGSLPHARVTPGRVNSTIGMDYCGPFKLKQSTVRRSIITKGYVLVMICFVTKLVTLELCSDLTTECFLAAFKRFCARRGMPGLVFCDNAATYKGANNQLRQLFLLTKSQAHKDSVINYSATKGIDFKFIPSYSPTFGGLWEACVKSFKYHLKRVVGDIILTYEQFYTVMVQIEGILNSRPLTSLSNDLNNFSYLTPAHFVCGAPLNQPPEPDLTSTNINTIKFWKKCTKVQQDFWKVWQKSYLSQLLKRPKWQSNIDNVNSGSLVLLTDERTPPLQWPLAKVEKVFPGPDGRVRVVEVRTAAGGSHRRAINKVAVLPIYEVQ